MDDFLTLARARWSVRSFSSRPIEKDKLELILKAGQVAPTAVNYQPQKIYVIQSQEALRKIRDHMHLGTIHSDLFQKPLRLFK